VSLSQVSQSIANLAADFLLVHLGGWCLSRSLQIRDLLNAQVTLGVADQQGSFLDDMSAFCDMKLAKDSIYAFLHRERERLFPDASFADLFDKDSRRSVPPRS
jgi:hypothetical protein